MRITDTSGSCRISGIAERLATGLSCAAAIGAAILLAGAARAQTASYDAADRLTLVRYDATNLIHYVYDAAGNLASVVEVGPDATDFDSNTNGMPDRVELNYLGGLSTNRYVYAAGTAALGTPNEWLALYGYTGGFDAAERADPDGDSVPNWLEYRARTNPLDTGDRPDANPLPYAESFENLAGWGGVYTNVSPGMGWRGGDLDRSRLVRLDYVYAATNRPLPGASHTNALFVDSRGGLLTNTVTGAFIEPAPVTYIDLMLEPRPNQEPPVIPSAEDPDVKCAVFADADSRLAVYHGVAAADGARLSNTVTVTSHWLNPTNWARLTLALDTSVSNVPMVKVFVDGLPVTSEAAHPEDWKATWEAQGALAPAGAGGTWFRQAVGAAGAEAVNALNFGGRWHLDDLVVSSDDPFAPPVADQFLLLISLTGAGRTSFGTAPFQSVALARGGSTQVVYEAEEWHRIGALARDGESVAGAAGRRAFTQEIVNVAADVSNDVAFALATPEQTGYAGVPTEWLSQWGEAAVAAGDGDAFGVSGEYLLGLDPVSANTHGLVIESVSVSEGRVVTVVRRDVTGALAPGGVNGQVWLKAAGALGAAFTNVAGTAVSGADAFDAEGRRAFTNDIRGAAGFFKVTIE